MSSGAPVGKVERKERSRERILASAARLLRERGIVGTRVADVMDGAHMTVGGFYAHFASKEELVDTTVRQTAAQMRAVLFDGVDAKPAAARTEVVLKRYLSAAHRDTPASGCVLPALAGEVGTSAPEHAGVLGEQVAAFADGIEATLAPGRTLTRRTLALALVALAYGGITLARALRGTPLSDEVLAACRELGVQAAKAGRNRD